jgi:hypothetical protein
MSEETEEEGSEISEEDAAKLQALLEKMADEDAELTEEDNAFLEYAIEQEYISFEEELED